MLSISSASVVVGPLAPSTITLAFMSPAFFSCIWCPRAAGTKKSHSSSRVSSLVNSSLPGYPRTDPVSILWANTLLGSSPSGLNIPPRESLSPIIRHPILDNVIAACTPTLPNPCTTTVASFNGMSRLRAHSLRQIAVPLPVASVRPSLPPSSMGFPVTTSGTEYPCMTLYVSMIHAMVWASVYISGAGTSR